MDTTNQQLIDFLTTNPNATKAAIAEELNTKGLTLFNLIKKAIKDGQIVESESGEETTYSIAKVDNDTDGDGDCDAKENFSDTDNASKAASGGDAQQQDEETTETDASADDSTSRDSSVEEQPPKTGKTVERASSGRDSSKYLFNGQELGKGPLVRAVVAQYVKNNDGITYERLKEAFPDSLLHRFGIFQELEVAKKIAKGGRRYFFKEDQLIALDESIKICVTNQFTLANIQPFLAKAKELDFVIG